MTLVGIALGLASALLIAPLREAIGDALSGNTAEVRSDLRDIGAAGVLLVAWLALIHTIVWYPAEILDAAAGFVYGFGPALPLVMVCWIGSALVSYYIGRHAGRPLLYRIAGEQRFRRAERMAHDGGASLLLAMRLIPIIPFSLFSTAAGAARVPLWRFTWTTFVGYLPITAYFIYLGSRLEGFSADDPILWIGAIALTAMLIGFRYLRPRERPEGDAAAPVAGGGPEGGEAEGSSPVGEAGRTGQAGRARRD